MAVGGRGALVHPLLGALETKKIISISHAKPMLFFPYLRRHHELSNVHPVRVVDVLGDVGGRPGEIAR